MCSRFSMASQWGISAASVNPFTPNWSRQRSSTGRGVRNDVHQFTVVPPPTLRPWRMRTDWSSVARFPISWYRCG